MTCKEPRTNLWDGDPEAETWTKKTPKNRNNDANNREMWGKKRERRRREKFPLTRILLHRSKAMKSLSLSLSSWRSYKFQLNATPSSAAVYHRERVERSGSMATREMNSACTRFANAKGCSVLPSHVLVVMVGVICTGCYTDAAVFWTAPGHMCVCVCVWWWWWWWQGHSYLQKSHDANYSNKALHPYLAASSLSLSLSLFLTSLMSLPPSLSHHMETIIPLVISHHQHSWGLSGTHRLYINLCSHRSL